MTTAARRPERRSRPRGALTLAVVLSALPAAAQQGAETVPGPVLRLDVTSGVTASDNIDREREPAGTSVLSQTNLRATYDARTRTERLTISGGVQLEFGAYADEEIADPGLKSPFLRVAYQRRTRSAQLSLDAAYSVVDVGRERVEFEDLDGDGDPDDLILDRGTRAATRLGAGLVLGRDGPATYSAELGYADTRYSDTTDPDLNDSVTLTFDQGLSLALTRTTRLLLDLDYRERDEDDAEETFESNIAATVGLSHAWNTGLSVSARLGYSVEEITRTRGGARSTERQDAPVFSMSLSQQRPNGEITASLSRQLGEQGTRTTLRFGRALELPRSSLDASLGITAGESDDDLRLVGNLAYSRPTPRGALTLRLSQQVSSDEDTDVFSTVANLGYRHELSRLSQVSLSLGLAATDAVDPDETDRQRTSLQVAYSRRLTEDWNFNLGLRHSTSRETGLDPIIENAVFATVSRRFDLLP
ncbi:MAG: Surface antigen [Rhodobacteraceae bacterium HLUCCA09]|nr:MAG: Surface antigen [Rhodobacteraceae bacterium HLUCCA09]